ncbi:uncharacterized protein LOC112341725 [Selaginella moellendorffii]|uniref:uncharacterized protein LOC112341725 n=1 Tax=Selaginella moellendorffii TaxID=88036 RepID=UPI000D1C7CF5|nr:uncharacterized protein LOC112341725 [Selaginella moellendorffii]|eukprot:XP_024518093.1 uncharacterized protein LOC112341725 [Selaginella moellendorffii]
MEIESCPPFHCSSPSPSKRDPTENSTMQVTQRRDFYPNSPCAERSRPTGDKTRSNTSIHSFLSHTTLFDEDWELLRFKLAAFQVTKTPNCSLLQSKAICQILAMIHPSFQVKVLVYIFFLVKTNA